MLKINRPTRQRSTDKSGEGVIGLFDLDLWAYDIGYAADAGDTPLSLSWVYRTINARFEEIKHLLDLESYEGYLTGKGNFRYDIAVTTPYKSGRKSTKPTHWQAIRDYLINVHGAVVVDGMEADDMLAIRQTELGSRSIIISRDKDLRQVPGWHYGYPVGNQPEFGPWKYDQVGDLDLTIRRKPCKKTGNPIIAGTKLAGGGDMFFWSQVLTGDDTDTYPGCKGVGDIKAYNLLKDCQSYDQMQQVVLDTYKQKHPEDAVQRLTEQARLAWMVREIEEDGSPKMWEM